MGVGPDQTAERPYVWRSRGEEGRGGGAILDGAEHEWWWERGAGVLMWRVSEEADVGEIINWCRELVVKWRWKNHDDP